MQETNPTEKDQPLETDILDQRKTRLAKLIDSQIATAAIIEFILLVRERSNLLQEKGYPSNKAILGAYLEISQIIVTENIEKINKKLQKQS